jgi:hypothetical protein
MSDSAPSFYASPAEAMRAPAEEFLYAPRRRTAGFLAWLRRR